MSEPDFPRPRAFCGDRLMGFRASWNETRRIMVGRGLLGLPVYGDRTYHHQGWFLSGSVDSDGADRIMVLPDDASTAITLPMADVTLWPVFQTREEPAHDQR